MTTTQEAPSDVSPTVAAGLATLDFTRSTLNKLVDGCPDDKRTHQPCPGANHVTWVLGHLAWTDDYFLTAFAGQESKFPEGWDKKFGMNTNPVDDASEYPAFDEVRAIFNERRDAARAWLGSMDDAKLAEKLPDEMKGFAPTFAALMGSMAAHEGMHAGQVTVVRRSLGLDPVMM